MTSLAATLFVTESTLLNTCLFRTGVESRDVRFWQTGGGYDRNVFTEQQLLQKIAYIHQNPVRRRLVERPGDWQWSSVGHYEQEGSYEGPTIDGLV